jgi:hypothetical protein
MAHFQQKSLEITVACHFQKLKIMHGGPPPKNQHDFTKNQTVIIERIGLILPNFFGNAAASPGIKWVPGKSKVVTSACSCVQFWCHPERIIFWNDFCGDYGYPNKRMAGRSSKCSVNHGVIPEESFLFPDNCLELQKDSSRMTILVRGSLNFHPFERIFELSNKNLNR